MATEEMPNPDNVIMSKEDWLKINDAMSTYRAIEQKWIASRGQAGLARRVFISFIIADVVLFAALWLGFYDWDEALAWAAITFAAQEAFMAVTTFLTSAFRAA